MTDTVLLTGVSGFLGGYVTLALLEAGFKVRGTVRKVAKARKVRDTLVQHGADVERVEFVEVDLLDDRGWKEAVAGCRYVQHVASPFITTMPKDKDVLIRPAVEGTQRAVGFALASDVERVVVTSSLVAVNYGYPKDRIAPFTDADWTQLGHPDVNAYFESKTRAEQKAWAVADEAGRHNDLVAINPGILTGPLLDDDPGTSGAIVQRVMSGSLRAAPAIAMPMVDVRDVAAIHVAAMTTREAGGHRYLVTEDTLSIKQIGDELRAELPAYRFKLPWFEAPSWIVRLLAPFDPEIRSNISELDQVRRFDSTPAIKLLGRRLMPVRQAVREMGRSLITQGLA